MLKNGICITKLIEFTICIKSQHTSKSNEYRIIKRKKNQLLVVVRYIIWDISQAFMVTDGSAVFRNL